MSGSYRAVKVRILTYGRIFFLFIVMRDKRFYAGRKFSNVGDFRLMRET